MKSQPKCILQCFHFLCIFNSIHVISNIWKTVPIIGSITLKTKYKYMYTCSFVELISCASLGNLSKNTEIKMISLICPFLQKTWMSNYIHIPVEDMQIIWKSVFTFTNYKNVIYSIVSIISLLKKEAAHIWWYFVFKSENVLVPFRFVRKSLTKSFL